ncbi:hypothetical protein BGX27_004843, partial [Mortierella sp. AM989]
MQAFQARSSPEILHIRTHLDKRTRERIVLWHEIQQAYKHISYVLNGKAVVPYMTDDDYNPMTPLRIEYHANTVLEVVLEDKGSAINSTLGSNSLALPAASPPMHFTDVPANGICIELSQSEGNKFRAVSGPHVDPSIKDAHSSSDSLGVNSTSISSRPQFSLESYHQQIMVSMNQHFGRLQ